MRRFIVAAAVLVALAFPTGVAADTVGDPPPVGSENGMTVEITAVHLIAKVVVEVEATISCQPAPPTVDGMHVYWDMWGVRLWAKQANGRAVATAYADADFDAYTLCDGTPHAVVITASADPSGVPFKRGTAVVAMSAYATYWWEDWEMGGGGSVTQNASTGWIAVRLGK